MWWKHWRGLSFRSTTKDRRVVVVCALLGVLVLGAGAFGLAGALPAHGAPELAIAADASCTALARADQTATNGSNWGRTILSGHNAYHGWFGVDVCGNGSNGVAPNPANVSCDAIPRNWDKTGCAPGGATSDGYGLTFQCVELIARFSAWAYGDHPGDWVGNAPDLWLPGNHPSDFIIYPNGSSHAPVPGDILVWGSVDTNGNPWPAGPDGWHGGHVAVVAAVHNGLIVTAEQNVKWGSDDHPSDTLALTQAGSHWIVSGSSAHDTRLPTYRWSRTMGTQRATYGWLHSVRNDGKFPAGKGAAARVPKTTGTTPRQSSGGLPSLAAATVVTDSGGLADLVWTTSSLFGASASDGSPFATARSLGAPDTARLIIGQTPATVILPDGTRYSYAVGANGHLYVARTSPRTLGVYWFDHGAPPHTMLEPLVSATRFAGGMAVAAFGTDGNLWWRAGPDGQLGDWMPLGRPADVALTGSFALAGAPGEGTPLVMALGQDGLIHERVWQQALLDADGNVTVPAGWSNWITLAAQQSGPRLSGKLLVIPETPGAQSHIGSWSDTPLDVLALDGQGNLTWLHMQSLRTGWSLNTIAAPAPLTALVAGSAVAADATGAKAASLVQVYATGSHGVYQGAISVGTTDKPAVQPSWMTLPDAPAGAAITTATALGLGPGFSVLVTASADQIVAGGQAVGTGLLAATPSGAAANTGQAQNTWVRLGMAVGPLAFGDTLRTNALNAHWYLEGTSARTVPTTEGVQLSAPNGTAALMQGALAGDAAMTVRVALPTRSSQSVRAGLVLYLDDADWVTLLVDGSGHVALCGASSQQFAPCATASVTPRSLASGIGLRIYRTAATYTAEVSADGVTWRTVGQWTPAQVGSGGPVNGAAKATPTATAPRGATPAATATPPAGPITAAPLAYTAWGLYVQGSTSPAAAPIFTDFVMWSSGEQVPSAAG